MKFRVHYLINGQNEKTIVNCENPQIAELIIRKNNKDQRIEICKIKKVN